MLYLYSQLHLHVVRNLRAIHEVPVPWPCFGNPELMTLNELLYLRFQGALIHLRNPSRLNTLTENHAWSISNSSLINCSTRLRLLFWLECMHQYWREKGWGCTLSLAWVFNTLNITTRKDRHHRLSFENENFRREHTETLIFSAWQCWKDLTWFGNLTCSIWRKVHWNFYSNPVWTPCQHKLIFYNGEICIRSL